MPRRGRWGGASLRRLFAIETLSLLAMPRRPTCSTGLFARVGVVIGSNGWFAVYFDLDVVIHFGGRVSSAVETNIAAFDTFRINQTAFVRFDVGGIFTRPKALTLGWVIIKDGLNVLDEIRIVGDLSNDVQIDARL